MVGAKCKGSWAGNKCSRQTAAFSEPFEGDYEVIFVLEFEQKSDAGSRA